MTLSELRALALSWDAAGRPADMLESNVWHVIAWGVSVSPYRRTPMPLHAVTLEYIDACTASLTAANPTWRDDHLFERAVCDICRERNRNENLTFCTACCCSMCYRCVHASDPLNPSASDHCGSALMG
jgi:hypothetical protein